MGNNAEQFPRVMKHLKLQSCAELTLIRADGHYWATELQTFIPV